MEKSSLLKDQLTKILAAEGHDTQLTNELLTSLEGKSQLDPERESKPEEPFAVIGQAEASVYEIFEQLLADSVSWEKAVNDLAAELMEEMGPDTLAQIQVLEEVRKLIPQAKSEAIATLDLEDEGSLDKMAEKINSSLEDKVIEHLQNPEITPNRASFMSGAREIENRILEQHWKEVDQIEGLREKIGVGITENDREVKLNRIFTTAQVSRFLAGHRAAISFQNSVSTSTIESVTLSSDLEGDSQMIGQLLNVAMAEFYRQLDEKQVEEPQAGEITTAHEDLTSFLFDGINGREGLRQGVAPEKRQDYQQSLALGQAVGVLNNEEIPVTDYLKVSGRLGEYKDISAAMVEDRALVSDTTAAFEAWHFAHSDYKPDELRAEVGNRGMTQELDQRSKELTVELSEGIKDEGARLGLLSDVSNPGDRIYLKTELKNIEDKGLDQLSRDEVTKIARQVVQAEAFREIMTMMSDPKHELGKVRQSEVGIPALMQIQAEASGAAPYLGKIIDTWTQGDNFNLKGPAEIETLDVRQKQIVFLTSFVRAILDNAYRSGRDNSLTAAEKTMESFMGEATEYGLEMGDLLHLQNFVLLTVAKINEKASKTWSMGSVPAITVHSALGNYVRERGGSNWVEAQSGCFYRDQSGDQQVGILFGFPTTDGRKDLVQQLRMKMIEGKAEIASEEMLQALQDIEKGAVPTRLSKDTKGLESPVPDEGSLYAQNHTLAILITKWKQKGSERPSNSQRLLELPLVKEQIIGVDDMGTRVEELRKNINDEFSREVLSRDLSARIGRWEGSRMDLRGKDKREYNDALRGKIDVGLSSLAFDKQSIERLIENTLGFYLDIETLYKDRKVDSIAQYVREQARQQRDIKIQEDTGAWRVIRDQIPTPDEVVEHVLSYSLGEEGKLRVQKGRSESDSHDLADLNMDKLFELSATMDQAMMIYRSFYDRLEIPLRRIKHDIQEEKPHDPEMNRLRSVVLALEEKLGSPEELSRKMVEKLRVVVLEAKQRKLELVGGEEVDLEKHYGGALATLAA